MQLINYITEVNAAASNGKRIKLTATASGQSGTAKLTFTGPSGKYIINIQYLDEFDGSCPFTLNVNGVQVGQWEANQTCSDAACGNIYRTYTVSNVQINNGQTIEITAVRNLGEHGRVDYLELIPAVIPTPVEVFYILWTK
jgi:hypothetical protein